MNGEHATDPRQAAIRVLWATPEVAKSVLKKAGETTKVSSAKETIHD